MALFTAPGPNGETLQIDAPDEASAAQAVQGMISGGGGQDTMQGAGGNPFIGITERAKQAGGQTAPQPPTSGGNPFVTGEASQGEQFRTAFDPSQDSAPTAEGLDQRVNGEADDRGRWATIGQGLTMETGDEIMGLLGGALAVAYGRDFSEGYDKMTGAIRSDVANYSARHPVESTALSIGAGAVPMIAGGLAAKGISTAVPAIGKIAAGAGRIATSAAGGAVAGGAQGFASGEGGLDNRLVSGAVGSGIGAVTGAGAGWLGNKIGNAAGKKAGMAAVPTNEGNKAAATVLYDRAKQAGVAVQPRAFQRLTTILPQRMRNMDFDPDLHPKTAVAMRRLEEMTQRGAPQGGAHTVFDLGEVEAMRRKIRQAISAASGPDNKADRAMAYKLLDQYDNWMNGLQPKDMLAGGSTTGREAIQIVQEARGLWSRTSKGEVLADIVENAQMDDDVAGGIRRGFKSLAKNKERFAPFTPAEKAAIKKVASGGDLGWVTRSLGMMSPTSLGGATRGAAVAGLGVMSGNPAAVIAPGVGYVAKKAGDRAIRSAADRAGAVVRGGGAVPFDAAKAKGVGDFAQRLIQAGGQPTAGEMRPGAIDVMFPNDLPGVYR